MNREITKGSVFDTIEQDAGVAEQLKIKAALMDCIRDYIKDKSLTQQAAEDLMGVQRSRTGDLSRGHISVFSIDALVAMAARVGLHPIKFAA
ncbi:MAG: putative XRE-type DNA-binding protein [Granulosicoccus sp.]|jgi:predicted XRE-type DNA-binding protein